MASDCPICKIALTKSEAKESHCPSCGNELKACEALPERAVGGTTYENPNPNTSYPRRVETSTGIQIKPSVSAATGYVIGGIAFFVIGALLGFNWAKKDGFSLWIIVGISGFLFLGAAFLAVGTKNLVRSNTVIIEISEESLFSYEQGTFRWGEIEQISVERLVRKGSGFVERTTLILKARGSGREVRINIDNLEKEPDTIIGLVYAHWEKV